MEILKKIFISICVFLGLFSVYMFYSSYWKWDFNSEGKAFDPIESVAYDSSSAVWLLIAFLFFLPVLILGLRKFVLKAKG